MPIDFTDQVIEGSKSRPDRMFMDYDKRVLYMGKVYEGGRKEFRMTDEFNSYMKHLPLWLRIISNTINVVFGWPIIALMWFWSRIKKLF